MQKIVSFDGFYYRPIGTLCSEEPVRRILLHCFPSAAVWSMSIPTFIQYKETVIIHAVYTAEKLAR